MVSVELFRPEYYELAIEDAIKIGKNTTQAVVGRYFTLG
jgi:2-keto-myo-inositol isomerase